MPPYVRRLDYQLDAATGALVRVIAASRACLTGVSSDGTHVWVADHCPASFANSCGNQVTELDAASGTVDRVIHGPAYGLDNPGAVSSGGGHVWVASTDTVTTFPTS